MNAGQSRVESGQTLAVRDIRDRLPDRPFTLAEAIAITGRTRDQTMYLLNASGYRQTNGNGLYARSKSWLEVRDEIAERAANAPPDRPCFNCGRRVCGCGR